MCKTLRSTYSIQSSVLILLILSDITCGLSKAADKPLGFATPTALFNPVIINLSSSFPLGNAFQDMLEELGKRDVRRFYIYRRGLLVLTVEDRPGTLNSTANPGTMGVSSHPFIHATAFDSFSEDELGSLLHQATSFDNYIDLLIKAGYDVISGDAVPQMNVRGGFRIEDQQGLAGVIWQKKGQFASLWLQPRPGKLVINYATVTVYRKDQTENLFLQVQSSTDFAELKRNLEILKFRLIPIKN